MEGKPDWLPGFPVQIYCNREESSMVRESGPFTADTPIEDVQSWIDELGL